MAFRKRRCFNVLLLMLGFTVLVLTVLVLSLFLGRKLGLRPFYTGYKFVGQMLIGRDRKHSQEKGHLRVAHSKLSRVNQKIRTTAHPVGALVKREKPRSNSDEIINVSGGMQDRRSLTLRLACKRLQKDYPRRAGEQQLLNNLVYKSKIDSIMLCDYMEGIPGNIRQIYDIIKAAKLTSDSNFRMKDELDTKEFQNLGNVSFMYGHTLLRDSLKVLFVREPYSRLLFAYLQTFFVSNNGESENLDKPSNGTSGKFGQQCPKSVSFTQFLQMFIDKYEKSPGKVFLKNGQFQTNWQSVYENCSPCDIKYDYIGKLDKLSSELSYMFTAANFGTFFNVKNIAKKWERELVEQLVSSVTEQSVQSCIPWQASLTKVWKALQMMGIVPCTVPFTLNRIENGQNIKDEFMTDVDYARSVTIVDSLTKMDLVVKAYRLVPEETLLKLKNALLPEFTLFGYDPNIVLKIK